ncbi:MAG TPA: hypothetical protein VMI32_13695 [Candidatus Solibacter sp.]|nr:hypothetical protein [Candidatus Solibacter sp.]
MPATLPTPGGVSSQNQNPWFLQKAILVNTPVPNVGITATTMLNRAAVVPSPLCGQGDTHSLYAKMNGTELKVFIDHAMVWVGAVGSDALVFDGPIGIRSDNSRLQIELLAGQPLEAQTGHMPGCRTGPEESE